MDFHCETRLKNDRGEGIDTLYFVKEITGKGIRAYGYTIGNGKCGIRNTITDVPGVKVGHYTVRKGKNQTGVTVIIPCDGFVYERKPLAAVYALNGFGKTQGTVQIEELGVLETPIALTNTLNVGKAADGLVTFTEKECRKNGKELVSVNPVVGETNDSRMNQITERVIEAEDVLFAIEHAEKNFKQGAVGAGRGTVCFGLKGGIGSASRILTFGGKEYTIGVLVQSNFGKTQDLTVAGIPVGRQICTKIQNSAKEDKGSIMVIVGTDLPLGERQLKRVLKRAAVGLIRTGSFMGHGSGDVFIGFTNANGIPDTKEEQFHMMKYFPENQLDKVFRLVAEAVEESILNSLTCAKAMPGRDGEIYHSLSEFL
ncbi:MAG TPA: aminopeptidase [Lachnospiraceae bacterium]|nr:aminopeptidase [Lachnospiraceae bacterium]